MALNFNIPSQHHNAGAAVQCGSRLLSLERSTATQLEKARFVFQRISINGVPVALRITSAILAWIFFFYFWWRVLQPGQISPHTLFLTGSQVLTCALGITAVASVWILHNLTISLTDRRQLAPPQARVVEEDALGRTLVLPSQSMLLTAPSIIVWIENGKKVYQPEPECNWNRLLQSANRSAKSEAPELEAVLG
jgi:hypothetical protein